MLLPHYYGHFSHENLRSPTARIFSSRVFLIRCLTELLVVIIPWTLPSSVTKTSQYIPLSPSMSISHKFCLVRMLKVYNFSSCEAIIGFFDNKSWAPRKQQHQRREKKARWLYHLTGRLFCLCWRLEATCFVSELECAFICILTHGGAYFLVLLLKVVKHWFVWRC